MFEECICGIINRILTKVYQKPRVQSNNKMFGGIIMMFVEAKIYYRGRCPTAEYVDELAEKFSLHIGKVELEEIEEASFAYSSQYVSHVICPGNPELTYGDRLEHWYLKGFKPSMLHEWDFAVWPGTYGMFCERGDYQVLTYVRISVFKWLYQKIFCR